MKDYLIREFWFNLSVCLSVDVSTAKTTIRSLDKDIQRVGFDLNSLSPELSKAYHHYTKSKVYLDL